MDSLPDRKVLEAMKRADLQKICKDYGIKANLKTEALIDSLLNVSKLAPPTIGWGSDATPDSIESHVAVRRGASGPSTIARDTDAVEAFHGDDIQIQAHEPPEQLTTTRTMARRTEKAKITQTRLGVGKPLLAGGTGARASLISKGRTKRPNDIQNAGSSNREATGDTLKTSTPEDTAVIDTALSNSSQPVSCHVPPHDAQTPKSAVGAIPSEVIDRHVAIALRPLLEQMEALQIEHANSQTEIERLKVQVADTSNLKPTVQNLGVMVEELRSQADDIARLTTEVNKIRQAVSGFATYQNIEGMETVGVEDPRGIDSDTNLIGSTFQPTTAVNRRFNSECAERASEMVAVRSDASKHNRDSIRGDVMGTFADATLEGLDVSLLENDDLRPRKRSRRETTPMGSFVHSGQINDASDPPPDNELSITSNFPDFAISNSFEEPPEDFSESCSQQLQSLVAQLAAEDRTPFNFSFPRVPPTGHRNETITVTFPYPDPPQSPSPVSSAIIAGGRSRGAKKKFRSLGAPPPRPVPVAGSSSGTVEHPSQPALQAQERRQMNSNMAAYLRATSDRVAPNFGVETEVPSTQRTMYGTELDANRRFGDFGSHGVGSEHWPAF